MRGRDIKRYSYDFADLYLLFIPWHFPLHNDPTISGASDVAEKEFENQYPAVYSHLLQYKEQLSNRNKAETGIRYEWYALQRWGANYWEDFSKQKIIWKRIGSILRFSFDDKGVFTLDSTCFASGNHIKYLVAILNSKIGNYLLQDAPKTGTGDLLISVQAIEPIKIPRISIEKENKINSLIDFIIKRGDNSAFIEEEINKFIYELYELNQEEIKFIESQQC